MYRPTHSIGIFGALILMLCIQDSHAGSATWDVNPSSGDWNTATNWTPTTVPNGFGDVATFGFSHITDVFVSHPRNTQSDTVDAIIFSASATNPYTITIPPGPLNLFVGGIVNNSGVTQNFVVNAGPGGSFGELFVDGVTVGGSITFTNNGSTSFNGGLTVFSGGSASDCTFINNGNRASVGFANAGTTDFLSATTYNGTFINNGGTVSGAEGGATRLSDSTAVGGTFTNNGSAVSGAKGGATKFEGRSSATDSTLIANGGINGGQGGKILFSGLSDGGTSRVAVFGNGNLDISLHHGSVTIGSLEGDGHVFLGSNNLSEGSNNLSTVFSGTIADVGSLTKIGSGTLVLSGANSYSGETNVTGGILQLDGSITSKTTVGAGGTISGRGTINGNLVNRSTVSPGDGLLGTLAINGSYTQASSGALLIDIAGADSGQTSLLNVFGTASLVGLLDPVLQNGFVPLVGEQFVFLEYGSLSGALFIHDRNIDDAMEHWVISYEPGQAILTVAAGKASVPDQASTLLLMTLSLVTLLGLHANPRRS